MQESVFSIHDAIDFRTCAMQIFRHQFNTNSVYRSFCDLLYANPGDVKEVEEIPFLPIDFFKSHQILSSKDAVQKIFTSSGTAGNSISKHLVTDLSWYRRSFLMGFNHFYGAIKEYTILALLPNYLEREGSSLVYMVSELIHQSEKPESGFYLNNLKALSKKLTELDNKGEKVLLIGVSFALLDLVEKQSFQLHHSLVMETGGMKGRRKEMTRMELHSILCDGFGLSTIHSEYGMTELLSQAYSKGEGVFTCPPWMKVVSRDAQDPLSVLKSNKAGGLNIIDLANYNSCAFIATQDLGKVNNDGSFEVLGRFDDSDTRGCNLLVI